MDLQICREMAYGKATVLKGGLHATEDQLLVHGKCLDLGLLVLSKNILR